MDKNAYFEFLEELRKSGETNMYGAVKWLTGNEEPKSKLHLIDFELEPLAHDEAKSLLDEWMKNYNKLSAEFGWSKEMTPTPEEGNYEEDNEEYLKLFDEDVSKDIINNLLKILAEEEIMDELDGAKHIWYIEGLPFVVSYDDGKANLLALVGDRVRVYDKYLDEYCSDFGLDYEEARKTILDKTGIDFKPSYEDEFEDDSEEVYDYGSDEVIEDDFEEGE